MVKLELRLWVKIVGLIFIVGMISFLVREILVSMKNKDMVIEPIVQEISLPSIVSTVYFSDTCYLLDDNDRLIIDSCFVNVVKEYPELRIRIEGNTDNSGLVGDNLILAYKRAKNVAEYLIGKHGIDGNRILILGNGPARAIKDGIVGKNSDYNNCQMKLIDY